MLLCAVRCLEMEKRPSAPTTFRLCRCVARRYANFPRFYGARRETVTAWTAYAGFRVKIACSEWNTYFFQPEDS